MNNIKDFIESNYKKDLSAYFLPIEYIRSVTVYHYNCSKLFLYITARISESKEIYFNCEFDVENYSFEIKSVSSHKSDAKAKMTNRLIPIMNKDSLDDIAEKFLVKYYPEALEKSVPVNVNLLLERMNLNIMYTSLPNDIQGQIFFKKTKKGTVLINNTGNINFTVVHECVHWEKHKFYFQLFSDGYAQCTSENSEVIETDTDWMEWQANQLAPRILMPKATAVPKIEEMLEMYQYIKDERQKFRKIICELSSLYKVSKKTAKIRMIELGYKQAEGIFNFVDGSYLSNYWFKEDSLKQGETFDIGLSDALEMYKSDKDFRNLLQQGLFVYDDCHFCLNTPKYVTRNGRMTDYAKLHMEECCLIFSIKRYKNSTYSQYGILFRDANAVKLMKLYKNKLSDNADYNEQAKLLKETAELCSKIILELPGTFGGTVNKLMDMFGFTNSKLCEESQLSERTIQRIKNDISYKPTFRTLVALCIGMHLPPVLSLDLINKSGTRPVAGYNEDAVYELLLYSKWNKSIYEINEILENANIPVLSKQVI